MKTYNPITKESGYCIALARASVGIFLSLKNEGFAQGKKVIVPANLCYAGIYPIVYAGLIPEFCDVDWMTGNVTLETFSAVYNQDVVAAIVPHMYGNPVRDMLKIYEFCKYKEILLIEDCASAMGATSIDYSLGDIGDYVVYSTGYSKTLDLGFGGFLYSKTRDLSFVEKIEEALPDFTEENEKNMTFFSKLYRLIRNQGTNSKIESMIFRGLSNCCKDDFLHKIDSNKKEWLFNELEKLDQTILDRRSAWKKYSKKLNELSRFEYKYEEGAVPWRYNILVGGDVRRKIINECLDASLPVSDWYPCVTNLFDCDKMFEGAKKHESMVLNFPLLIDYQIIDKICSILVDNL